MTWAVYEHSHWQGAGADRVIAVGSAAACRAYAAALDCCSYCGVGPGNYQSGRCLAARKPGYIPRHARTLPEGAEDWEREDFAAWESDEGDDYEDRED